MNKVAFVVAQVLSSVDGRKRIIGIILLILGFITRFVPSLSVYSEEIVANLSELLSICGAIIGLWGWADAIKKEKENASEI